MPSTALRVGIIALCTACYVSVSASEAATISATSCSSSAVQAAIDSAQNGDTVLVPSGSCTWSSGVSISGKAIHLQGEAAGTVTLTHGAGSATLIAITEASAGRVEVSNLTLLRGSGSGRLIMVNNASNGRAVLIHDNTMGPNSIRLETNRGVIYRNTLNGAGLGSSGIQCKPIGLTSSWTTASTMGTADVSGESNVYVEDNTFTNFWTEVADSDDNCRIVFRYNTFVDSGITSHGPDTSAEGTRHWEVYNNTFRYSGDGGCNETLNKNVPYFFYIRGGTGIIADNVMPNLNSCAWGNKPEIIMTVQNLRRNAGPYACWKTYPAPRQVGQSRSGSAAVTDPVYLWGNTGGGNYGSPAINDYSPNECGSGAPSSSAFITNGRDYVVGVKPGYQKYPYPHPLRGGSQTIKLPSAPTNVRVQ